MTTNSQFFSPQSFFRHNLHSIFCIIDGKVITRANLLAHAWSVSKELPEKRYAVNLCQDRYLFTVSYLAAIIKNQITLLPPNQTPQTVAGLLKDYTHSYCLVDQPMDLKKDHFLVKAQKPGNFHGHFPHIKTNRVVSISFTSGSTGEPKAVEKTWQEFQNSAQLAVTQLNLNRQKLNIISTVPPQHMYGLETSIFWPFFSTASINSERPFFPEDIRQLAEKSNRPCLLVSTPTHLQACVRAGLTWRNIGIILSSTAPLSVELAAEAERCFNAPLFEIFGSTETLSYASRRLTENEKWMPYPGVQMTERNGSYFVEGGHLAHAAKLDDHLNIFEDGRFTVEGRSSDMIKIAGKRASLNELNRIINSIDGIDEGIFFQTKSERLGALVVTRLNKKEIVDQLKQSIDEVFLPRPLKIVDLIPRNEIGKIVKNKLDQIIKELDVA